ncbi:hypothetical protein ACJ3XI_06520 [Litorimonas sp. RW-G-Af-16]|uniref:hypothetical protein n=1 Tax=Litorimonas sp. RW-G-Af-16 TaxID=3241168 RepID=UPI00390C63C2
MKLIYALLITATLSTAATAQDKPTDTAPKPDTPPAEQSQKSKTPEPFDVDEMFRRGEEKAKDGGRCRPPPKPSV